jgi:hypothetical protein
MVNQSSTSVRVGQSKQSSLKKKERNIERISMSRTNYMFQQHRSVKKKQLKAPKLKLRQAARCIKEQRQALAFIYQEQELWLLRQ